MNVNFCSPEEEYRYCHLHNGLVKCFNQIDGLKQGLLKKQNERIDGLQQLVDKQSADIALLKNESSNQAKQINIMANALNNVNRLVSSGQSIVQQLVNNINKVNSLIVQQHHQQQPQPRQLQSVKTVSFSLNPQQRSVYPDLNNDN